MPDVEQPQVLVRYKDEQGKLQYRWVNLSNHAAFWGLIKNVENGEDIGGADKKAIDDLDDYMNQI